jgi:hypothetical protein
MNGKLKNLKRLKNLWRKNLLHLRQAHRPSKCGKRRQHHHHHKKHSHLSLHHRDQMMHPEGKDFLRLSPVQRT